MAAVDHLPDVYEPYQVQFQDTSDGESDGTGSDSSLSVISEICENINECGFAEERRIYEVLRGWMPDYIVRSIQPCTNPGKEPIYSAKLGKEPRIKRSSSSESLSTQLSLLSCSTYGKKHGASEKKRKRNSKGTVRQTADSSVASKWIALNNRRQGAFDKLLRQQSALTPIGGVGMNDKSNNIAFEMMDKDEQTMLLRCGVDTGIKMAHGLKKSGSTTNICNEQQRNFRRYSHAAIERGHMKSSGNIFKKAPDLINTRNRSNSKQSLSQTKQSGADAVHGSLFDSSTIRTETPPFKEKVSMWQVDDRILDVDLNRGLSAKVKNRIASTTMALDRVSRNKDDPRPKSTPGCIRTDPDNPRNIRLSPELSNVIKQDIRVRMGQPRYHEIRKRDVQIWDRGHELGRSQRNLKVFNWLHSLKEDEFELSFDENNNKGDSEKTFGGVINVHVDAVDEPSFKPLRHI